jgi:uncharacterized repeat protein (TIGR02543 family)
LKGAFSVKKILSLFMGLVMVTMLCVPTFAATSTGDIILTYDLKSNGSNDIVVQTGDTITVTYSLSASESTRVSATQNEIYYDTDFFELDTDSISDSEGFEDYLTANKKRQNGNWYVFFATAVTHVHDSTPSEIGTFRLKVIAKEGETTVANTSYGASDSKNEHYGTAAQNLHVSIGEQQTQKFTVTFNGGNGSDAKTQEVTSNQTITIPEGAAKSGYTFNYWQINGDSTQYKPGDKYTPQNDVTFNAVYTQNSSSGGSSGRATYTLTYNTNGGTEISSERVNTGTSVDLTKKVTSHDGYDFGGWYTDAELTKPVSGNTLTVNGNTTLYAWWIARTIEGSITTTTTTPELLVSDDHFAYIMGYTDGKIRPEANITRAEAATIFFRLLKEDVRESNLTKTNNFSDVNEGNWFNTAVSTMANLGILKGRSSGQFDPNAPITRAELAAICARFDEGSSDIGNSFSDISGHWAESEIKRASSLGWIEGYTDGTFRPDKDITRAESMTLINRVLNRIPENTTDLLDDMNIWSDNKDTTRWYYLAVQEATNSHTFNSKNESNETWSAMSEDPDWTRYQ